MISASLDAWLRPSRTSQPNTRTMIRYSRRTDTNRDLAPTRGQAKPQVTAPEASSEAVQAVHARVENGWVILAGEVGYDFQRREVERMVRQVRG